MRNNQTRIRRRHLLTMALALAAPVSALAATTPKFNYGKVIDAAGRQRMLTQRIVKAYCQIGLGVTPVVSRAQLDDAVTRFGEQIDALSSQAPTPAARQASARVRALWAPFRALAVRAISHAGAHKLADRSEPLLLAAHELVLELERAAGTPQARLVNMAGRQRMLSQRLAKAYMLRAWKIDTPAERDEFDRASNEFTGALATLRQAEQNTPAISRELDAVGLQWEWFSAAIELQGAESYTLIVAGASESILNSMDLVTHMYAALAPP